MNGSTLVLSRFDNPCPQLDQLMGTVLPILRAHSKLKKKRKPEDQLRYEASARALLRAIAIVALEGGDALRMPFNNAVLSAVGFRTHARTVRNELKAAGLIKVQIGYFDAERPENSKLTLIGITPQMGDLIRAGGLDVTDLICAPQVTTVLRSEKGSDMPELVGRQDHTVRRYNDWIGRFRLHQPDGWTSARIHLVRVFKADWGRGGRLYGGFWIDMPRLDRATLLIDGEETCELDFKCLHPRMLYAKAGLELDFDPYVIPGFDHVSRDTGKKVFNTLVNGKTGKLSGRSACRKDFTTTAAMSEFAEAMVTRLEPIRNHLGTEAWGWLQTEDSEIALRVMERCMLQDIPVYPIHDGFLTKRVHKYTVYGIMISTYRDKYGIDPIVEEK